MINSWLCHGKHVPYFTNYGGHSPSLSIYIPQREAEHSPEGGSTVMLC